ncbi:MAG: sugar transferase [Alphaproteobacteria bacterium]
MRILYLDQYFSDRDGISGTRGYEFARRWVAQGHQVTVLALASRYSSLSRPPQTRFIRHLRVEGIDVVSVRIAYAQQMGALARVRAFFSFMFWAALIGIFTARHDVVFASSTPLTVGLPGSLISRVRGTPFVFEVRDLWPRAPIELGMLKNPVARFVARAAEKLFYRLAARIVALSPGMVDGIAAAGGDRRKIHLIPNACDFDLFDEADPKGVREELGLPKNAVVVVHAGNLGPSNDGRWLLNLASRWQKEDRKRLWLLLLGEGSERRELEARAAREKLDRVVFAGPVSRREAARIIKAGDIGLVSFADLPVLATNSPNKFFDYLAAGLPTCVNTRGWTAELIAENEAGLALPRDPKQAAMMLADLAGKAQRRRAMGRAARDLATRFDRDKLAGELRQVLGDAAAEITDGLEPLLKRWTDRLLVGVVLLFAWPVLLALALAIKLDSRGPVFYKQPRIGRGGEEFSLWKFRTMVVGADKMGDGLNVGEGDPRITRVGKWLREWSLDEAPQIFNVLLGQMSLVGPRPALLEHVAMYNEEQKARLRVLPGLTGLAQVSGRNLLTWDDKLAKDVEYARTWSWWGDIKLILKTLPVVLRREGLYEPDAGKDDRFNVFDDEQS